MLRMGLRATPIGIILAAIIMGIFYYFNPEAPRNAASVRGAVFLAAIISIGIGVLTSDD